MTISKADVAMLGRKREQPVKAPGELMAVWVAGNLRNFMNTRQGWRAPWAYSRKWKERVAQALLEDGRLMLRAVAPTPKRVTFQARTWGQMDSDGLQAALKPVRDALVECGVIHGDAEKHGHEFVYQPSVIDRKRRGVEIRVSLR